MMRVDFKGDKYMLWWRLLSGMSYLYIVVNLVKSLLDLNFGYFVIRDVYYMWFRIRKFNIRINLMLFFVLRNWGFWGCFEWLFVDSGNFSLLEILMEVLLSIFVN